MKKKSQKDKVAEILQEKGYIDNVYDCVRTALTLRLSNKIRELEAEGWVFDEIKSGYYPEKSKNWRYYLKVGVKQPFMPKFRYVDMPDGSKKEEEIKYTTLSH